MAWAGTLETRHGSQIKGVILHKCGTTPNFFSAKLAAMG